MHSIEGNGSYALCRCDFHKRALSHIDQLVPHPIVVLPRRFIPPKNRYTIGAHPVFTIFRTRRRKLNTCRPGLRQKCMQANFPSKAFGFHTIQSANLNQRCHPQRVSLVRNPGDVIFEKPGHPPRGRSFFFPSAPPTIACFSPVKWTCHANRSVSASKIALPLAASFREIASRRRASVRPVLSKNVLRPPTKRLRRMSQSSANATGSSRDFHRKLTSPWVLFRRSAARGVSSNSFFFISKSAGIPCNLHPTK